LAKASIACQIWLCVSIDGMKLVLDTENILKDKGRRGKGGELR
jgi:hypothetical protein